MQLIVCGTVYSHTAVAITKFFGYHLFYKLNNGVRYEYIWIEPTYGYITCLIKNI